MSKLFQMRGLPAAGKSTKAAEIASNGNCKRINFDLLREMLDFSKWSKQNEKFLHTVSSAIAKCAVDNGYDVIMDNTNLSGSQQQLCARISADNDMSVEVIDMTDVDVHECIERDANRSKRVGAEVIMKFYNDYVRTNGFNKDFNSDLPDGVIVDLDGTIADHGKERSPFDGEAVYGDAVRFPVVRAVKGFIDSGAIPLFVSGREDKGGCRDKTSQWLSFKAKFHPGHLYMREKGDMRKDYIVKTELYEKFIKGKFNVVAIFDDRAQVVRNCWDKLGFGDRIFRVGRIDADNF